MDITDKELGLIYSTDPFGTMMISTKMVDLVQEEAKAVDVVQEEERLAGMGAYLDSLTDKERAYLIAMVDKRNRSIDDELAQGEPPSQRLRTEAGPAYAPRRQQQPPQQQPVPQQPIIQQPSMPSKEPHANPNAYYQPQGQPCIPDPFFEQPENQYQPQFILSATMPKPRKKPTQEPKTKRHIKMMKHAKLWDPVDSLRCLPVVGLDFGSLFDWAPRIRIAIAKALQMEGDKKNKQPLAQMAQTAEVCLVQESLQESGPAYAGFQHKKLKSLGVVDGVLQEPDIRIFNFHTMGEIWPLGQHRSETACHIGKILIDGGAVVNLMPEITARKLNLKLFKNDDIMIRTVTNEIRAIQYCTNFDITIAGVTAHIRVYVIDIPQSYSLLLGRRWLYQVRVIGDYEMGSYTIYDADGRPHKVTATNDM